jgi:chemotaxis protein histidine kinase CheA
VRLSETTVVYYLRLLGMACRKVGLECLEHALEQLVYDHRANKDEEEKQIAERVLQRTLANSSKMKEEPEDEPSESGKLITEYAQPAQKKKPRISKVSTLDSILLINCQLVLVHADANCCKILDAKARQKNKIFKRKEHLQFYLEEHKSKEYWLLAHAHPHLPLKDLIKQLKILQLRVLLEGEPYMKFIVLFEGAIWSQGLLNQVEAEVQPVYRFHYANSATSVYYHCNHIQRHAIFSTVTKNMEITAISAIVHYFLPRLTHAPFRFIDFSTLDHAKIVECVEQLKELSGVAAHAIESRLFALLVSTFREIKQAMNEYLNSEKDSLSYRELFGSEGEF